MKDPYQIVRAFLPAITEKIIESLSKNMAGNAIYQVVGVYITILTLSESNRMASTTELARLGKTTTTTAAKHANELYDLGWITKHTIHSSHGRGRQYYYLPVHSLADLSRILGDLHALPPPFQSIQQSPDPV